MASNNTDENFVSFIRQQLCSWSQDYLTIKKDNRPYILVECNGRSNYWLFDTGSQISCVQRQYFETLDIDISHNRRYSKFELPLHKNHTNNFLDTWYMRSL